jgi:hypothetical protein
VNKKLIGIFVFISTAVLFFTGAAKIVSAVGNAGILGLDEPVFGLTYRHLFYLSGSIELLIAIGCYLRFKQIAQVITIGWFALCAAIYRLAFHYLGPAHWCPCLGTLTGSLHISPKMTDWLLVGALTYLIAGSMLILVGHCYGNGWRKQTSFPA